jgi:hypothetical protein
MGWRGTLRSVGAAMRAAERDAQRRHKAAMKAQMIADAEDAVNDWENYIDDLLSVHVNLADEINWSQLAAAPKPEEPARASLHETKAKVALERYKPGFIDKMFGQAEKRRASLQEALAKAPEKDEEAYQSALIEHQTALADWHSETDLARKLIAGETEAIRQVIEEFQSLSNESLIGRTINFRIEGDRIHAIVQVHTDEIIPSMRRKQLASGKLSESKMPVGQFNELYQDYVCSVALKVAGDLFRILPQTEVFVTCESEMLDTVTGHKQPTPILSVQFVQETFMRLDLAGIDPSDSMRNFNHNMRFAKTKGFAPVEALHDGIGRYNS